jgi:mRNA interferase RelE/StbE
MARVVVAGPARAELAGLPWPITDAAEEAIGMLEGDPRAGHRLRGRLAGVWSLRIGSYRILYQLIDRERTVRVLAVRHRSVAYGRDPR